MGAILLPETEQMLQARAVELGLDSVDTLVRMAMQSFESNLAQIEPDDETWVAIERADSQPDLSVEDVEARLANRLARK